MRVVLQRVTEAEVTIDHKITGQIQKGLLVLVGITPTDTHADATWLAKKIVNLRIFNDENGLMNLSLNDVGGKLLVVSQFTLYAATKKGNRPSYIRAAKPDIAIPLYEHFIQCLQTEAQIRVETAPTRRSQSWRVVSRGAA